MQCSNQIAELMQRVQDLEAERVREEQFQEALWHLLILVTGLRDELPASKNAEQFDRLVGVIWDNFIGSRLHTGREGEARLDRILFTKSGRKK